VTVSAAAHVHKYIEDLLGKEGGYVDHQSDKGGETNWGITVAVARAFGYTGSMRDLPRATAYGIYLDRYWIQPGFNRIDQISGHLAEELFDTGVNMGPGTAAKFLQRALNTLNNRGRDFPEIAVDGAIGKMTIYCLQEFLKRRGQRGEVALFRMLNGQQSVRYMELSEANQTQDDFQFGWQFNRVAGGFA